MSKTHSVQILEPHIPTQVVCTFCGIKQRFVKETEYWKTVKAPHLKHPLILKIRKSLDRDTLKPSSTFGDKWKLFEGDLKPSKDVSITSNSSRSLTTSNYLCKITTGE